MAFKSSDIMSKPTIRKRSRPLEIKSKSPYEHDDCNCPKCGKKMTVQRGKCYICGKGNATLINPDTNQVPLH